MGCIDCAVRREHLSPEKMSINLCEVERAIIKLSETNPELNFTKEPIENIITKNSETNVEHIKGTEQKEAIEIKEVKNTEVKNIVHKDYSYIIFNGDTNIFCSITVNSPLDVLKEVVKMNTDNITVLKKVEGGYKEVELLK